MDIPKKQRLSVGEKIALFFFLSAGVSSLLIIIVFSQGWIEGLLSQSLAVLGISAGVAGGVGFFLNRGLHRDLSGLMDVAQKVSQGELHHRISDGGKRFAGEIDDLSRIFGEMQANLTGLVGQIQETSQRIGTASDNLSSLAEEVTSSTAGIAATMTEISKGTDNQSKLIENTSTGMREMVAAVDQTEQSARESASRATNAVNTAQDSSRLAGQAVDKMRQIFERVEDSSRLMVAFSDKIKQVSRIVVVIGGIAQKTTLLALNATIEAAKAGEYGRGFAVVADEIRKLAESTTRSAEQITELIQGVESESRRVLEAMQASVDVVTKSRSDVTSIGDSLDGIVASFKEVQLQTLGITDLARAEAEQSQQILRAMEEIQKVAERTAASTMEISAATNEQTSSMHLLTKAAQELSQLAEKLRTASSRFDLGGQGPRAVA